MVNEALVDGDTATYQVFHEQILLCRDSLILFDKVNKWCQASAGFKWRARRLA